MEQKVLTFTPFERKTPQANSSSTVVTPFFVPKAAAGPKHQVVFLNHFVDYFVDEYLVEYIALRILLPTGIDYDRMPDTMTHTVATDGFSYSVKYLLPDILSDTNMVNHHWSTKPLSATYTAGMRNGVLTALNASILNYRTKLGHTMTSERLFAKFTVPLDKQCYVDVPLEFIKQDGVNKGICLNVILKCKKMTIQNVNKALRLSTDDEDIPPANVYGTGTSFGMPPPLTSPPILLPSHIPSYTSPSMYEYQQRAYRITSPAVTRMNPVPVPHVGGPSHVPSQFKPMTGHPHLSHINGQMGTHAHVPAMKMDQDYLEYLAHKIQMKNQKVKKQKPTNQKITPLQQQMASKYGNSFAQRSSNQSVASISSKRSKYNPEKDPLVIQARKFLPGSDQLSLLKMNAMKAQAELEAHTKMAASKVPVLNNTNNNENNLIGMSLKLQLEEEEDEDDEEEEEEEEEETPTQILTPTQTQRSRHINASRSYHALHGQTEEVELGNGNNSEPYYSDEELK